MTKTRIGRRGGLGLAGTAVLLLAGVAFGADDARTRIRETNERIKDCVEACRDAQRAARPAPTAELRAELESLAGDAEGLKALAKYLDHPADFVAFLAVRAIAGAPEALRLAAGRILAARVDSRYLTDERQVVYVETVRALGRTGYLGGVEPLLKTLNRTRDADVCQAIVEALGRLGDVRAVAVLHDRLNTGTSANLRGPAAGSAARRRSQNPRQAKGLGGSKNNVAVTAGGELIETLAEDRQPVDEKGVTDEIYATLSKLLGAEFTSWHAVDEFRRENKKELKAAEAAAERTRREQDREASQLLK